MKKNEMEFFNKLADLLEEYNVTIEANDEFIGWPECGEEIQIRFDNSKFEFSEVNLGSNIGAEDIRKEL